MPFVHLLAAHGDKETADVLELGRQDRHKYREVVHKVNRSIVVADLEDLTLLAYQHHVVFLLNNRNKVNNSIFNQCCLPK